MMLRNDPFIAHERKVTDIWMQHNKAIVSSSHDMKIHIKCTMSPPDFDDQTIKIDGYEEELQCIAVIENQCAPANLNCFVGTMEGHLIRYNRSFFKNKIERFGSHSDEGAVTQVIYRFGILVWSTPKKIRIIHYKRNKQKICMIPVPDPNQNIP